MGSPTPDIDDHNFGMILSEPVGGSGTPQRQPHTPLKAILVLPVSSYFLGNLGFTNNSVQVLPDNQGYAPSEIENETKRVMGLP
jgi:hypothetical protein